MRSSFDSRMVLMSIVATVWGVRLTYNFTRQGGYSLRFWAGEEDYRWAHVRDFPVLNTKVGWTLFDFVFISIYQNILLLWIALPIVNARNAEYGLGAADWILAASFLGLVAFETYVDQTQWNFQKEKKRLRAAGEPLTGRYAAGFIHDGVWAYSRHPNYLAEQLLWIAYFLFSVAATHRVSWTIGGCLLLVGLFQGSSRLSESIQLRRYPGLQGLSASGPPIRAPTKGDFEGKRVRVTEPVKNLPLCKRRWDIFFMVVFGLFACTSAVSDAIPTLGVAIGPHASFLGRINWAYGHDTDPLFIRPPVWMRFVTGLSAFVYGPFYLLLVYCLATGRNWIQVPAVMYATAISFITGVVVFGAEFFGTDPAMRVQNVPKFLVANVWYVFPAASPAGQDAQGEAVHPQVLSMGGSHLSGMLGGAAQGERSRVRLARGQLRGDHVGGLRSAEVKSLGEFAAEFGQGSEGVFVFDALGDDCLMKIVGEQ